MKKLRRWRGEIRRGGVVLNAAAVLARGGSREEGEVGRERATAKGGVEGVGGLKKNGKDENEKEEGGVEKGEWAETSTGANLKAERVGEECVERQGGEGGGGEEKSELGHGKLGKVVKFSEKPSQVDDYSSGVDEKGVD